MSLELMRKKINEYDQVLLETFQKRMAIVKEVALYKLENQLEIFQPEREQEILDSKSKLATQEYKAYVVDFFQDLMHISKQYQTAIIDDYKKKSTNEPSPTKKI